LNIDKISDDQQEKIHKLQDEIDALWMVLREAGIGTYQANLLYAKAYLKRGGKFEGKK
jgi:hypothetical protein